MSMRELLRALATAALALPASTLAASVLLSADNESTVSYDPDPTYSVIREALGRGAFNNPDCTHPDFGPHIARGEDAVMGRVFQFHLHVTPDGDSCLVTNHPRNEIKVDNSSSPYLKVFRNDTVRYRWRFRLPEGFQSSYNFTYIHQIKAVDGDFIIPLIAFNLQKGRNGKPDLIGVNHADSNGVRTTLASTPVAPLLGEWVEAYETITADTHGQYAITLTRVRDGAVLLSYSSNDIDMWRFSGTTFIRPKWGLYRSVDNPQYLRDETVLYKQFCLAKAPDDCESTPQVASPVFSPAPGAYTSPPQVTITSVTPGATLRYRTDGAAPDCTSGTPYTAPLVLTVTTTLSAIACRDGWRDSTVLSGSYTLSPLARLPLAASALTASASADSNHRPVATIDGNLGTFWAAQGVGQWIQYDLQAEHTVSRVAIAWYRGNQGRARFDIQVSSDGMTFTSVHAGQSSGKTTALEAYDFPGVSARYVRIVGQGNSVNTWNMMAETEIWGLR